VQLDARLAQRQLRRWLRRHLPDAMVPPEFVFVDLGGHSMAALQVVEAIAERLGELATAVAGG
jgi:hypothetical protein